MASPAGPAPLDSLRSPVGTGKAACVLLGAVAAADVVSIAAGINARQVFAEGTADDFLRYDEAAMDRADMLYRFSGTPQVMTFLAAAVVFLIWFRRVRLNAEVFDAHAQPMRPGWAIGAWFVPVANFFLPYRVASGIWTASTPAGRPVASRVLLNAWWAGLIGSRLFVVWAERRYAAAEEVDEVLDAFGLVVAGDVLDVVAAVLAILFVRRLTAMQGERAAPRAAPVAPMPAAEQTG
ncbi:DUF4328 domain-containing protein [Streptomyces poriferorum]|uniref:DUF4328 domain-containing protein n=1 Tax=Streptomyces poriferorum TaxID=2798799 RepID=UPI001F1F9D63|nr:DUF4328 domain-containing protein [Streptomyces poriferorum]